MAGPNFITIHNSDTDSKWPLYKDFKTEKTGIVISQLVHILLNLHASTVCTWALEILAGNYRNKQAHEWTNR